MPFSTFFLPLPEIFSDLFSFFKQEGPQKSPLHYVRETLCLRDHLKIPLDIQTTSRKLIHDAPIPPDTSNEIRIKLIRKIKVSTKLQQILE